MRVAGHLTREQLAAIERVEQDAGRSKRLRIVILAVDGWSAPAIAGDASPACR